MFCFDFTRSFAIDTSASYAPGPRWSSVDDASVLKRVSVPRMPAAPLPTLGSTADSDGL